MNKYIIGIGIIIVAGIFFLAAKGSNKVNLSQVESELTALADSYDFGEIDINGGKVSTDYTLQNTGTEDLVITSGVTSCMCTEGKIDGEIFGMHDNAQMNIVVPAGGEKVLTAIFDPLAHGPEGVGPITRELTLGTNSTMTPRLTVRFSGNVIKK